MSKQKPSEEFDSSFNSMRGHLSLVGSKGKLVFPESLSDSIKCSSVSEYACIFLLEKYTNWKAINGITFQINVGKCVFDFVIDSTLIEFHPISLRREFISAEFNTILSNLKFLPKKNKHAVLDSLRKELECQYAKRRSQIASADPKYKNHSVMCVFSTEDFVSKVLLNFANKPGLNFSSLCKEFRKIRSDNKRLLA